MILFKKTDDLRKWLDNQQLDSKNIGFVPTMGALHAGHISLIKTSKKQNAVTVCSIFVNPAQFNDSKDFEKYPVTIKEDILLLEEAGCDVLFLPSVTEIYPNGLLAKKYYDLGFIETVFDGKYRPGHFQGVCMVVENLLKIVLPDRLYLGQKDYQQCMVITKLTGLIGFKNKIEIIICPTLREKNGLAMSSRNMRLSKEEREKAGAIFKSMTLIKENIGKETLEIIKEKAYKILEGAGLKPDYVEIVNAEDLSSIKEWNKDKKAVVLVAAFMNEVRLIDNMLLN
jgi:pantoate--beta-alanine ligase